MRKKLEKKTSHPDIHYKFTLFMAINFSIYQNVSFRKNLSREVGLILKLHNKKKAEH